MATMDEFNHTDDGSMLGHCLHRLLENATDKHSKSTAVICAGNELTYETLNARSNRFARILMERGTERGDLVGVALDRSVDLLMVLIAVLKAGAAYVPIDPAFPAERITHMLEDADPKIIITNTGSDEALSGWKGQCLKMDEVRQQVDSNTKTTNVAVDVQPEDLAYVIYTSGSTGKPKGVEISHGALCNHLLTMRQQPGCSESERLLAITTISFDIAALELFLPLLCGATVVIAQRHEAKDASALMQMMQRYTITMMQATPATWQMLLDSGWQGKPSLNRILCGGEALSRKLADRLLACGSNSGSGAPPGSIWNMYGPTEATVWASTWKVRPGNEIFIGNPIANYRLYVLGDDLKRVPPGESGELFIGGSSLARGYHNKPDVTAERFIHNPFHDGLMYRTGDVARFSPTGHLSVLGRADNQVKVRGHRIELGDIEAAIMSFEAVVSEAVVISRDDRLVAYCIRNMSKATEAPSEPLDELLRPWLAERLPSYMIPAFFVEMETFPKTPNEKVDRKALPDPLTRIKKKVTAIPVTELETGILAIWSDVLGHDHIGTNDNFFQIGGDSVRAVRVAFQLEKLVGRHVSPAKLFEHFTIKTLAAFLAAGNAAVPAAAPAPVRRRVSDNHGEDIAIVSMACRLPGGVSTPEEFWELLAEGGDAITDVPKDRWDAEAFYSADPDAPGKSYCRRGGFLGSVDSFDAAFFGISPREARALDPMQAVMLETCWEGFERAGYTAEQLRGSQTGVFIGTSNLAAQQNYSCAMDKLDGYAGTGTAGGTMSGRVSYFMGLEGPTLTIDTACSSSLVTTHLACNALRQGECDVAVSGGVTLLLTPGLHVEFSRLRGMSPDGRCRAFSSDTDGTGWAEGAAVVVLKRLSDAQRDGDRIHAVLRGSAVNHGGRSAGLTTPSGPAQTRLVRSALAASGLQPADIDYVEAHGTGTKLGDPIEGGALADVFRGSRSDAEDPLWIGSAKSNIGHTQAAAGLVGLLKVVLAMRHGTLPQTLHIAQPTPAVDWRGSNMALVQQQRPWLSRGDRLRRAGVSAFGIGGTNAHVIVEEPPKTATATPAAENVSESSESVPLPTALPFLLSAPTEAALQKQSEKLRHHLAKAGAKTNLGDLAYSLASSRNHFRQRMVLSAKDEAELLDKLAAAPDSAAAGPGSNTELPKLAMLFTGQGSQLPGMGQELAQSHPVFRNALEEIAARFVGVLEKPLLDVMWAEANARSDAGLLHRTEYAQPALFALQVALWRQWESLGVRPDFVLGHSVGEFAAAHVAGVLDLDDACRLVAARAQLMQALPGRGGMISLEASAAQVADAISKLQLGAQVDIATHNTPTQTVASGDIGALRKLASHFAAQRLKSKPLDVSHAFHSHHMDPMLAEYRAVAETVRFNPPKIQVVSGLTGKLAAAGQLEDPAYWVQQVRNAVCFSGGMRTLADEGATVFLELGPRPILCGLGAACLADDENAEEMAWLPSLVPKKNDAVAIQGAMAVLHVRHVPVNWSAYFEPFGCQRIELPTYAFKGERFRPAEEIVFTEQRSHAGEFVQVPEKSRFAVNWCPVDVNSARPSGRWGLLCPAGEVAWAAKAKAAISSAGIQLTPVARLDDARNLDGLVCFWDSDSDVLHQTRDFTNRALSQVQSAASTSFSPSIVWVTRQAVGCSPADLAAGLGAAPLWGLLRTACNEHPDLNLRIVDVPGDDDVSGFSPLGRAMMLRDEPECAVRQGQVLIPQIQLAEPLQAETTSPLVRKDGAVLITGGLGDIGSRVAKWLARTHGVSDLVLTSRRGGKTPGAEALVKELEQLGATATVVAGDMANFESVASIMSLFNEKRPLRGVVHTAGVLADGVLSGMTPERCNATFEPKTDGAWHLHQLTQNVPTLDLFLMFSSISGVMGTPGQANYAAANTFLDALAHLRHNQGLPATSVAWGLWSGSGMGAGLNDTGRMHHAQLGHHYLTEETGLTLFEHSARSGAALTVAAALELEKMQTYFEDRGGIPPLFNSLLRREDGDKKAQEGAGRSAGEDLSTVLGEADPKEHAAIVLRMVRQTVAKTLGFSSPEEVDTSLPLQAIGIDSLTAILFRNQLAKLTGLTLSTKIAFLHPNLKALSQALLSELQENLLESSSSASVSSTTPATTVYGGAPSLDMAAIRKGCLDPSFMFGDLTPGPISRGECPESVLVLGATGFVGAFVVHEMLRRNIATYCLVRSKTAEQARERIVSTLQRHGLWKPSYETILHVLMGDMAQPMLGLTEEVFDDLADRIDAICHSGARVDWMLPLEEYVGPNIVSTHEVLRLASRGREKAVHVISTVSTLAKHAGYEVTEQEREYGYATSKYLAERMVAAARWRGARASVYRLPFVTASASTGHFRLDRGDFMHNLVVGCVEMGSFPSLEANFGAILPVDYLAGTVAAVMTEDQGRIGLDFDFLNPRAPTFDAFFGMMTAAGVADDGKKSEILPFATWRQKALDYAAEHPRSPVARIAAVVDGLTDESAVDMMQGSMVGQHVLGGDDYPVPEIDEQCVRRYLERINASKVEIV